MKLIKDLGMRYVTPKSEQKKRMGIYRCPLCETNSTLITPNVNSGNTKSCLPCRFISQVGRKITHGLSAHKLYPTWCAQKQRCNQENDSQYYNYGGRGISISKEFLSFDVWLYYIESLDGAYEDGKTIDRINNNGNYERGNIRWATKNTQARNTRRIMSTNSTGYRGVTKNKYNFTARICVNNKNIHISTHKSARLAAIAYDKYVLDNDLEHTTNGIL